MTQIKQINAAGTPFTFPAGSNLEYPLAPVITAHRTSPDGPEIYIRVVVFIDASFQGEPTIGNWSLNTENNTLSGFVDYDAPSPRVTPPLTYNSWLVETTYDDSGMAVDDVELFLRDTDPKTSRGTVTTVQHSFH